MEGEVEILAKWFSLSRFSFPWISRIFLPWRIFFVSTFPPLDIRDSVCYIIE